MECRLTVLRHAGPALPSDKRLACRFSELPVDRDGIAGTVEETLQFDDFLILKLASAHALGSVALVILFALGASLVKAAATAAPLQIGESANVHIG
jgi:hypothetical protein